MADGEVTHDPPLSDIAPILQDLDTNVSRILGEIDVRPRQDIIESLMNEIDEDILKECRDLLFKSAVERYDEILDASGIEENPYLQMKKRKTNANDAGIVTIC